MTRRITVALVTLVLATMTGNRRATWVVAAACAAFYGLVFVQSTPAHFWHAPVRPGSSIGLHARPAAIISEAVVNAGVPVTLTLEGGEPVDAGRRSLQQMRGLQ